MPFVNSPNMGLPIPGVSTEPGPQFANDINQALSILDSHTHGPGSGVPIGSQGISLQSDLAFNINNATSMRSVRFTPTTASSGTDTGCIYVKGADLFYNDINANIVRITFNGGIATTALTNGLVNTTAIISGNSPQIPATSGFIRMDNNTDFVSWRNAANTADDRLYFDNSDALNVIGPGYGLKLPNTLSSSTMPVVQTPGGVQSAIAQLTRPMLPTVNQISTSGTGNQAISSNVFGTLQSCLINLTTTGRPVMLMFNPTTGAQLQMQNVAAKDVGIIAIASCGTGNPTNTTLVRALYPSPTAAGFNNYNGSICYLDSPPAGNYNYSVLAGTSGGTGLMYVNNYNFVAYEL